MNDTDKLLYLLLDAYDERVMKVCQNLIGKDEHMEPLPERRDGLAGSINRADGATRFYWELLPLDDFEDLMRSLLRPYGE